MPVQRKTERSTQVYVVTYWYKTGKSKYCVDTPNEYILMSIGVLLYKDDPIYPNCINPVQQSTFCILFCFAVRVLRVQ